MSYAICFNLDQSKILSSGKGLNDEFCLCLWWGSKHCEKKPFLLFSQCFLPYARIIMLNEQTLQLLSGIAISRLGSTEYLAQKQSIINAPLNPFPSDKF